MRLEVATRLIALAAFGCLWNGPPHRPLGRPLNELEVVGVWHATNHALADYAAEGLTRYASAGAHRLEFRADRSCAAKTLSGGTVLGQPVEADMPCTWNLVSQPGGPEVRIEVTVRPNQTVGDGYTIAEEDAKLLLWSYITDPDARRYAEFTKER